LHFRAADLRVSFARIHLFNMKREATSVKSLIASC
jgi:hypothetical protein